MVGNNSLSSKIVPVEPNLRTYTIDPHLIEDAITYRTKAIMPVHLYGNSCDMNPINKIAEAHNLFVIDDAAQAHGTKYMNNNIGNSADATAWSFYPGKNLGALGDGGAVTTNNPAVADKLRTLRNYGSSKKYYNELLGYNTRLDPIQAEFLNLKLTYLDQMNSQRADLAHRYLEEITNPHIILPFEPSYTKSSWHLFVIRTKQRELLVKHLESCNIQTLIHYPIPPHLQKAYYSLDYQSGSFPISETIAQECLSIPLYPGLSEEEVSYVIESINRFGY